MNDTVRQSKVKIRQIGTVKKDVFLISFSSRYLANTSQPGNFLHLKVEGVILRRPFSVHRVEDDTLSVLFKVRGRGTRALAGYRRGMWLDVIGPLGCGFRLPKPAAKNRRDILVAGGIGVAPFIFLAQTLARGSRLKALGSRVVLLGAKSKDEVLCEKEFKQLGWQVKVATEDGSRGFKGTVTQLLKNKLSTIDYRLSTNIYACGPTEMFKAIHTFTAGRSDIDCQVSFEQFMGCGLGVCCACVIKTRYGYKKVCTDGPVFNIRDI